MSDKDRLHFGPDYSAKMPKEEALYQLQKLVRLYVGEAKAADIERLLREKWKPLSVYAHRLHEAHEIEAALSVQKPRYMPVRRISQPEGAAP